MEVGIILGQDAFEIQKALEYKMGTQSEPVAVLTDLGWVVSGHMKGRRGQLFFVSLPAQKTCKWQKTFNPGGT